MNFLLSINNFICNVLILTESKYCIQNSRYVPFCDMVCFVPTWSLFAGPVTYYRRFIAHFAKIAGALHALRKKNSEYVWTAKCQGAFDKLRNLLTSAPVLAYPDFGVPFILETDASGNGLGAVLAQRQDDGLVRPIAYASRSLQEHEKRYGVTELEGLGVVWALKHFRPYLYGQQCDIYTDYEALKSLLNSPQPSGKLARWGMAIQELDVRILNRSGRHNSNADALSRVPLEQVVVAMEEATVNGVSLSGTITPTKLGPAVYSEVIVNGVNVTALIDTGSPVSIMSLKKAIQILALRKGEFSSPQ